MANFGDSLKAGWRAAREHLDAKEELPSGTRYLAGEHVIQCTHCRGELFESRDALLNSTGMTLLNLDWLDQSARALICVQCTAILWFASPPTPLD